MLIHYRGNKSFKSHTTIADCCIRGGSEGVIKIDMPKGQIHLILNEWDIKGMKKALKMLKRKDKK